MNEIPKTWKMAGTKYHYLKTFDLEGVNFVVSKFWTRKYGRWIFGIEREDQLLSSINFWINNA
jgi:hypothetical protein